MAPKDNGSSNAGNTISPDKAVRASFIFIGAIFTLHVVAFLLRK